MIEVTKKNNNISVVRQTQHPDITVDGVYPVALQNDTDVVVYKQESLAEVTTVLPHTVSRAPIQSVHGAKHTGVHESAHYATDSQVRRGKTRSPFRLSQISADMGKLAREEGRADGTADRYYPGQKPNAYQRGEFFQTAEDQAQYEKIRAKVAGGKKPKSVVPKVKITKPLKIAAAIK